MTIKGPIPISPKDRMHSREWRCPSCDTVYRFDTPQPVPAPCEQCGCKLLFKVKGDSTSVQ